ncbi:hypothetical protein MBRA1_002733 [Malassezia brasiliensis]|uniref:AAA+ ATPase domain-containing protein n=1 Tax=Malassezia brasiliensis TaxID=1821822 RepID=A0AAF0IPF5_9BASI|nr:hypothetical protein MBRA1_002733 [Malassezia brasiliensis]
MAPDERGAQAPRLFPIFAGGAPPARPPPSGRRTRVPARTSSAGAAASGSGSRPSPAPAPAPVQRAVRGTGSGAPVHPLFAKRYDTSEAPRARAATPHVAPAPPAPWPRREEMHVAPPTHVARADLELPPTWRRRAWPPPRAPPPPAPPFTHTPAAVRGVPVGRTDDDAPIACEATLSTTTQVPAPRAPLAYIAQDLAHAGQEPARFAPAVRAVFDYVHAQPAQSLADARPADAPPALWVDRWRPTCAAHVLGNEEAAAYLCDWLHTLRVSYANDATRKRRVQTRVPQRKRGRPRARTHSDDDEFDSEEEAWLDQFRPPGAAAPRAAPPTNCLLIAGPTGSGKSAAVHACAQEAGYTVFELYAGVGRRSGKDLVSAVGQLSRNHMVAGDAADDAPRQSLILLDDVDVLFDDDAGFWAAVVELVRDSHRPVVLTCTDVGRVPVAELPIQTTLSFAAPPLDVGATYLQLVALAEGYIVSQASMRTLYAQTCAAPHAFGGSGPVHPGCEAYADGRTDARGAPAYDLRAALMQLQWVCLYTRARALRAAAGSQAAASSGADAAAAVPPDATEGAPAAAAGAARVRGPPALQLLDGLRRLADTSSVCDVLDTELVEPSTDPLPPWSRAHITAVPAARCTQPADAPLGATSHAALVHTLGTLAARDWRRAAHLVPGAAAGGVDAALLARPSARLDAERLAHGRHVAQLLALLRVAPGEQLPRAPLVVEYAPYVRQMMYLDQLRQVAYATHLHAAEGVRATRNSTQLLYDTYALRTHAHQPWIALGPTERAAAHATQFAHP